MRQLTKKELSSFDKTIARYIKAESMGTFHSKITDHLPNEVIVKCSEKGGISRKESRKQILRKIGATLQKLGYSKIVVFRKPWTWDNGTTWEELPGSISEPVILSSDRLEIVEEKIELVTDYYIAPTVNEFEWIIKICHEGDFHLFGKEEFTKSFIKFHESSFNLSK